MTTLVTPIIIYAAVIYFMARLLPRTNIRNVAVAIVVAVLVALLNVGISFGMRYSINDLITFFTITFFVRMILTTVALILLARLFKGFAMNGFWPAVLIGLAVTVTGTIYDSQRQHDYPTQEDSQPYFQKEEGRRNSSR